MRKKEYKITESKVWLFDLYSQNSQWSFSHLICEDEKGKGFALKG
jgi:hypothetical protein